ncbi:MAG: glycosyltransferase [Chthoniobacterales bacterium]
MRDPPTASIVVAAYNRANVLRYAIQSVMRSTNPDWELIVIGDGCTDDSEQVVRSFSDPRITFQNLPANTGGQSAPHNAGVALSKGKYVLFLNQDDMYFADHIERAIYFMETSGTDLAWSPVVVLENSGLESGPPDPARDILGLHGAVAEGGFDPRVFVISSSWIVRRDVCLSVGPWLAAEKTRLSPSQEWLFRAWRKGKRLTYHPYPSVLCIHSGARRFSYLMENSPEHERGFSWIAATTGVGDELLRCLTINQSAELHRLRETLSLAQNGSVARRFLARTLKLGRHVGLHPAAVQRWLEGQRKGQLVSRLRAYTAESPPLDTGETLNLGQAAVADYLGGGWHPGEGSGRWTSRDSAELFMHLDDGSAPRVLEVTGGTLRNGDEVVFSINGKRALVHRYASTGETVRLPLGSLSGNVRLTIFVEDPTSPSQLGSSTDERTMGMWVCSIRVTTQATEEVERGSSSLPTLGKATSPRDPRNAARGLT